MFSRHRDGLSSGWIETHGWSPSQLGKSGRSVVSARGEPRPRVLIVDGEAEIVSGLREFLIPKAYEVLAASDGQEALQKVWQAHPHAVLLASRLPTTNGLEVLRQIRALDRDVGIIMIAEARDETLGRVALQLGACDYIRKPLNLRYLELSLWHTVMLRIL